MRSNAPVLQLALVGSNDSLTIAKGEKAEYMDCTDANGWVDATRGRMGNFSSNCYFKKKKSKIGNKVGISSGS